jgi:arylsulfatase
VDLPALSTHLDIFPTLAVAAGAKIPENLHLDGRSLLPLLRDAASPWPDRTLFTHVGGWELGAAARSKFAGCSVRNDRYALVNNSELYDLRADPGETRNVVADHPSEADQLREAYDAWWNEVQSGFVNESAAAPKVSAFDERYREQARRSGPLDNPPF